VGAEVLIFLVHLFTPRPVQRTPVEVVVRVAAKEVL
jgi:hypothetical protein